MAAGPGTRFARARRRNDLIERTSAVTGIGTGVVAGAAAGIVGYLGGEVGIGQLVAPIIGYTGHTNFAGWLREYGPYLSGFGLGIYGFYYSALPIREGTRNFLRRLF